MIEDPMLAVPPTEGTAGTIEVIQVPAGIPVPVTPSLTTSPYPVVGVTAVTYEAPVVTAPPAPVTVAAVVATERARPASVLHSGHAPRDNHSTRDLDRTGAEVHVVKVDIAIHIERAGRGGRSGTDELHVAQAEIRSRV